VPYLVWTVIYWVFTLWQGHWPMGAAYSDLWRDLLYGYYQLYFCIVLFQLYLVFPFVYRWLVVRGHHLRIMTISLVVALVLATILHWPGAFGPVGHAAFWLAPKWPWARDILTYQEQVIAGILVALHVEKLPAFIERWGRWVVAGGAALLAVATMWYLIAVWTGSPTGRASDRCRRCARVLVVALVRPHVAPGPVQTVVVGNESGEPHRRHLFLPGTLSQPVPPGPRFDRTASRPGLGRLSRHPLRVDHRVHRPVRPAGAEDPLGLAAGRASSTPTAPASRHLDARHPRR
jgi:hypothetical protein